MNKEFIFYEQALELKKLGFDELCFMFYNPNGNYWENACTNTVLTQLNSGSNIVCSTPLYQQAFRWFREKHNLQSHIEYNKGFYEWRILLDVVGYDTYEEAELACLKKLIEIVKKNNI